MKKLLSMMLMLALVLFYACDDDEGDDTTTVTPDEAKQEMQDLSTDMTMVMTEMQNSEGMKAFQMMMALPSPFEAATKSSNESQVFSKINNYLMPNTILSHEKNVSEAVPFDFNAHKGVYTYINTYPYWTVELGGDVIEINFPTTEENQLSGTNDGQLIIYNYQEILITETDEYGTYEYYNPTALDVEVYVNDIKAIDIDMTATWETTGEYAGEPKTLDVDVYVIPFTFHFDFNHQSTSAAINGWIEYDGAKILSVGLSANFTSTNFDDTPEVISGYIQLFDVKFNASIQAASLEDLMEGQETDPPAITDIEEFEVAFNALIDADVEVNGAKAADISADFTTSPSQYTLPVSQEDGIYVNIIFTYNDGSTESALPYFASFMTGIQEFLNGLDGYYGGF